MNQHHPYDIMREAEARVAFLSAAAVAFCEIDPSLLPQKQAWEGLFYLLLDVQSLLGKAQPPAAL